VTSARPKGESASASASASASGRRGWSRAERDTTSVCLLAALECNGHRGCRTTGDRHRRPADTFCFRLPCQSTRLSPLLPVVFPFHESHVSFAFRLSERAPWRRVATLLIALPISTRARSRTASAPIGFHETRDQLTSLRPSPFRDHSHGRRRCRIPERLLVSIIER